MAGRLRSCAHCAFPENNSSERMRARGARLGLKMAGSSSTRLVIATGCDLFVAREGSTSAGARALAKRDRLRDHRSRCRGFRDDSRRRFSSRAASTSSPDDGRAFGALGAPGPGEGSAHQIAALVVWLKRHGVDFSDRARFARVRGMGVGGVATRDLRQGDAIFSLPLFGVARGGDGGNGGDGETGVTGETGESGLWNEGSARSYSSAFGVPLVITTSVELVHRRQRGIRVELQALGINM